MRPTTTPISRPDKSAALKAAHQAAANDKWYRSQVAQRIEEADAPEAEWFSTDQVFAEIDKDLEEITGGRPE